jgi:hypothetical protein
MFRRWTGYNQLVDLRNSVANANVGCNTSSPRVTIDGPSHPISLYPICFEPDVNSQRHGLGGMLGDENENLDQQV